MTKLAGARVTWAVIALTVAVVAVLAGCGTSGTPEPSYSPIPVVVPDKALAARVPEAVRASGTLTIATDPTYPPMEFTEDTHLLGVDIDLGRALAQTLELEPEFVTNVSFSNIVAAVAIDRYELGMSSLWADNTTATLTDMVTYMQAGVQMASRSHGGPKVRNLSSLCGLSVALEEGTEYIDELVKASKQCVADGKKRIRIEGSDDQQSATAKVASGQADVMLADSPAVQFAVDRSQGKLAIASRPIDVRPYGIAVSTSFPEFAGLIRDAMQRLMDSGIYDKILTEWDLAANAVPRSTVLHANHTELLEMPSEVADG